MDTDGWERKRGKLSPLLTLMLMLKLTLGWPIMDMVTMATVPMDTMDTLERRRGKLSPLLMLMLKLIPGTGTMAIMVTTVPMDTIHTGSTMEGSRTLNQDNLRNMILL